MQLQATNYKQGPMWFSLTRKKVKKREKVLIRSWKLKLERKKIKNEIGTEKILNEIKNKNGIITE